MARPPKAINWDIVRTKMEAGLTAMQIATDLEVNINTFYNRFKEEFGHSFSDFSDDFHSAGKGHIAWIQYMKAKGGNIPMLLLLGKEWLGQGQEKEKESPYEDTIAMRHENMTLRYELQKLKEALSADKREAG